MKKNGRSLVSSWDEVICTVQSLFSLDFDLFWWLFLLNLLHFRRELENISTTHWFRNSSWPLDFRHQFSEYLFVSVGLSRCELSAAIDWADVLFSSTYFCVTVSECSYRRDFSVDVIDLRTIWRLLNLENLSFVNKFIWKKLEEIENIPMETFVHLGTIEGCWSIRLESERWTSRWRQMERRVRKVISHIVRWSRENVEMFVKKYTDCFDLFFKQKTWSKWMRRGKEKQNKSLDTIKHFSDGNKNLRKWSNKREG